ncbi:MAG: glucose-6-phosphate isomerase, partial [Campylobacterales bacterium]
RGRKIGYYHLPEEGERWLNWEPDLEFSEVVVVGIGGSSLGTKAVYDLNRHFYPNLKPIYFLENPDPLELEEKVAKIQNPLFFVISKSGRTVETISILKFLIRRFQLGPRNRRLKVITGTGSPLDRFGKEWGLERFPIPEGVGGRFSVLSPVGLIPLKSAGFPVGELLDGGKNFRDSFFRREQEHLLIKGAFYADNWEKYPINVLFAYSTSLQYFKEWYVQLLGESLGKEGRELMPVGHLGSIDQHSFLQLLMEGVPNKSVTFLKIANFHRGLKIPNLSLPGLEAQNFVNSRPFEELINLEERATLEALKGRGLILDEIVVPEVNLYSTGQLIFYYQLLTSLIGGIWGIDTYNQEGVEVGKRLLPLLFNRYSTERDLH